MTSITEEITRLETEIALAEEEIRRAESLGKRGVNAIGRIRSTTSSLSTGAHLYDGFHLEMASTIAGGWSQQRPGTSCLVPGSGHEFRHSTRWVKPGFTSDRHIKAVLVDVTVTQQDDDLGEIIRDLDISVELADSRTDSLKFEKEELNSLIAFCVDTANVSLFFIMLEHLYVKSESRWTTVQSKDFLDHAVKVSENRGFVYNVGSPVLASINWTIQFDSRSTNVEDRIQLKLTREGQKQAHLLNFPSEFVESGKCSDWSETIHLKNIIKMASFQHC